MQDVGSTRMGTAKGTAAAQRDYRFLVSRVSYILPGPLSPSHHIVILKPFFLAKHGWTFISYKIIYAHVFILHAFVVRGTFRASRSFHSTFGTTWTKSSGISELYLSRTTLRGLSNLPVNGFRAVAGKRRIKWPKCK